MPNWILHTYSICLLGSSTAFPSCFCVCSGFIHFTVLWMHIYQVWVILYMAWLLLWFAHWAEGPGAFIFYALLLHICLWPLPGRLRPPAGCAPLSGRRSRSSGDLTWRECCWSSICPQRRTDCWTPKPVKHRGKAEGGVEGCCHGIYQAYRGYSHEDVFMYDVHGNWITVYLYHTMLFLYLSITTYTNDALHLGANTQLSPHSLTSTLFPWMITYLSCYGSTVFTGSQATGHSTSLISSARSVSHDLCSTEI